MARVSKKRLDTAAQACRQFLPSHLIPPILVAVVNRFIALTFSDRYTASQADVHVFKALGSAPDASKYPHTARWYKQIASYAAEFATLPGSSSAGEAFTAGAPAAAAEEEEEEVDLFGDDDAEEDAEAERIKAERIRAYEEKKKNKPKVVAKVGTCFVERVNS